jgi:hypothetical protein
MPQVIEHLSSKYRPVLYHDSGPDFLTFKDKYRCPISAHVTVSSKTPNYRPVRREQVYQKHSYP